MPKNGPDLLTQADYAKSRKARGLSGGTKQAVNKAVAEGRITAFGPDKLIDQALADAQWERNTRARVAQGGVPAPAVDQERPELPDLVAAAGPDSAAPPAEANQQLHGDVGYLRSRANQAEADARIAQMKAAELEGSLVRVDQVRAELASRLAPVREALLQIPARLAPLLAAQSDPGRIQTMLEVEIHQVIAPLGKAPAPEVQGGEHQ